MKKIRFKNGVPYAVAFVSYKPWKAIDRRYAEVWKKVVKSTAYRRDPAHLPKPPRDENRENWRRSKKDWRHSVGRRRGCSGCSACVRWEYLHPASYKARLKHQLRKEVSDAILGE